MHSLCYVPLLLSCAKLGLCIEWNRLGYEVAEIFTHKFNLLAPVWFQVLGRKKSYTISGIPNIDNGKFALSR
ncbi:hypothetical protein FGIG_10330 [Fasciola gigantica]|uniref:Uncharacterized protein n=1 Tax=Fasciola gigantica TaxID=46835 RepID=A0A504YDY8_FASGI|nr:hypothetical protein FGIG_10330 [Fasciola gigantica]